MPFPLSCFYRISNLYSSSDRQLFYKCEKRFPDYQGPVLHPPQTSSNHHHYIYPPLYLSTTFAHRRASEWSKRQRNKMSFLHVVDVSICPRTQIVVLQLKVSAESPDIQKRYYDSHVTMTFYYKQNPWKVPSQESSTSKPRAHRGW